MSVNPLAPDAVAPPSPARSGSVGRWLHRLPALIGVTMFAVALIVLHKSLAAISLAEIADEFRSLGRPHLFGALALTVASYALLVFYDLVGLRYTGTALPLRTVASTAFCAFAVGHNVGVASLSGGAIRYRAYSAAGVGASAITRVIVSCSVTFGLGVALVLGLALLLEPPGALVAAHVAPAVGHALAVLLLAVPIAWLAWAGLFPRPLAVGHWRVPPPSLPLATFQVALSAVDLVVAGAVVWLLMPPDANVPFVAFLGLYVFAMTLGTLSQVPGGLGVFEGTMVLLLPDVPVQGVLGALLAYRVIYYLLPLILALALLARELLAERDGQARAVVNQGALVLTRAAPQILAAMVFVAGVVLLLSGAFPGQERRLEWVGNIVPDALMQLSHLLGSAIGLALLVLARGLYRRLQGAFALTLWLLGAGIVVSLVKGVDYEEAIVLALAALTLWAGRERFHRRASLLDEPFTAGWIASVVMVVGGVIWIGLFAHQHVAYSHASWWDFAYDAEAPKTLRASLLVVILLAAFGFARLLRTAGTRRLATTEEDLALAAEIIRRGTSSEANVALSGDKDFLFHPDRDAFVMYRTEGRSAIALGDPVGNPAHLADVAWSFRELCDRLDLRCVFYQVTAEHLPLYIDLGLTFSKLGEEACIPLAEFALEGRRNAEFRQARNRALREGAVFSIVPAAELPPLLPELRAVSNDWLANKHVREKGFSVGAFDPDYLVRLDTAIVRLEGRVVAFANLWASGDRSSLSIDLMRHHSSAPRGIMDYLFVELMLWGKENGYAEFSLGMAPLSGLEHHPLATLWTRVGNLVFRFGDEF